METTSRIRAASRAAKLLLLLVLLAVGLAACGETEEGQVKEYGQAIPAGGGLVQSFVTVELNDGTEVKAWLPMDQEIWDKLGAGARSGSMYVEIHRAGADEPWEFREVIGE